MFIIEHYIGGAGELSNDLHQMLRRIMLEIKEEFKPQMMKYQANHKR